MKRTNTGKLISVLRTLENLSQARLAENLHVSRVYLNQVEKGNRKPDLDFLEKVSWHFDIPTPLLVNDVSENDSKILADLRKMLGEILVAKLELDENSSKAQFIPPTGAGTGGDLKDRSGSKEPDGKSDTPLPLDDDYGHHQIQEGRN